MATEEVRPEADVEEGFSPWGAYSIQDFSSWVILSPNRGDVIECELPPSFCFIDGVVAAFLVVGKIIGEEGDFILEVRSLGSTDPGTTARMSSIFNRRTGYIHICSGLTCTFEGEAIAFHLKQLNLWSGETFNAGYMGQAGRKMLKSYHEIGVSPMEAGAPEDEVQEVPDEAEQPVPDGRKPKEGEKEKKEPGRASGRRKTQEPEAKDYAHLRQRLDSVKRKRLEKDAEPVEPGPHDGEPLEDGEDPALASGFAQVPLLTTGRTLEDTSLELAAMTRTTPDRRGKTQGALEGQNATTSKSSRMRSGRTGVGAQLAMNAAVAAGQPPPPGNNGLPGPSPGAPAALVGVSKKKKKKKTRKKKKKKKGKRKRTTGGGGPGSSGSSSSSDESSSGAASSSEDSSESSKYLPPLRRKSNKKPGSVLQLLLTAVEEHLDAIGEGATSGSASLGGTKILAYYNALIKGGVNALSRDGREMCLLAICLDQLRVGRLAELGDGLASRFLALHQASIDGSWDGARNLEIHTPEMLSAAGPQVTIAARRHSRLLDRVRGPVYERQQETWKKGGWSETWSQQPKGWPGGKGRGKKGKQKGTQDPWSKGKGRGGASQWDSNNQPKGGDPKEKDKGSAT